MLSNRLNRSGILSLSILATIAALVLVLQAFFPTPAAPAQPVAPGTPVDITGVLTILYEDGPTGARLVHILDSAGRRYALQFATRPPKHLKTGDQIHVRGVHAAGSSNTSVPVVGTLALDSSSTSVQTVTPAPVPSTLGAQQTLVILVNFQNSPTQQPRTVDQVRSLVFGTISNFFLENSFQQAWLSGDVYGWYTLPIDSTVCDPTFIADYAKNAAAAAGADLSVFNRFVYIFPQNACTWSGLAWVGGSPSEAWINGFFDLGTVGHELGHNLGLLHSHGLDCDTSALGANCNAIEYGDGADIMGNRPGHFNAFQKEVLGWLNKGSSPPMTTVQTSGTYTLDPYEPPGINPKALKILKSTNPTTGAKTWYYVEYRQALGFDTILNGVGDMVSGVQIRTGTEESGVSSYLLDMTPNSIMTSGASDLEDGALVAGQTFSDPNAGVTISTQWANGTNAGVSVSLNQPCVRANPTVVFSPVQSQSVGAGTTVTYTVAITNNDGAGCSSSIFSLQTTVPSGWTTAVVSPTLSLTPGASASTTLTVTSSTAATDGSYTIGVTVANSGNTSYATSTEATYVIGPSVSVTVATDKPSYTRAQTVSVKAKVNAGGAPVAGAAVNFSVTKPNGAVATGKATTGTDGTAAYKLRLKRQDPVGTYQAGAVATENALSGSATTSFTVQ